MSSVLLAKPDLSEDWIDTSVGEAHVVRSSLSEFVNLDGGFFKPDPEIFEYQHPYGYKPLVKLLQDKHNAPVIITGGAKQAIGACFFALKSMGYDSYSMKAPYWALIPPLADMHGIKTVVSEPGENSNPYLLVAPNNPDNECASYHDLKSLHYKYMDKGIPLIHDAAYYTHSYLPDSYELGPVGDVQIFSTSKMFGLSGFRVGYAVCHNEKFAPLIQNYMETMTVGASSLSQQFLFHLFQWEKSFTKDFTNSSYSKLLDNKNLIKQINPLVLEVPDDFEKSPGMFGFFKKGPKANFAAAKVNVVDGKFFGKDGFVRLSLGLPYDRLKEVVDRLNNL